MGGTHLEAGGGPGGVVGTRHGGGGLPVGDEGVQLLKTLMPGFIALLIVASMSRDQRVLHGRQLGTALLELRDRGLLAGGNAGAEMMTINKRPVGRQLPPNPLLALLHAADQVENAGPRRLLQGKLRRAQGMGLGSGPDRGADR